MVTQADKDFLARVVDKRTVYVNTVNKLLSMVGKSSSDQIEEVVDGEFSTQYKTYRDVLQEYLDFNKNNSLNIGKAVGNEMDTAVVVIVGVVIAALVFAIGTGWVIVRGTNKVLNKAITEIDEGSAQVAAASSQVSAASNMLAEGASEQAASIEETSSSLEEMSSMTAQNAKSAQDAKALADAMHSAADSSADQMRDMQKAMDAIKESSAGISQIIKTIDEIAFQTNILALNAAVEAARAGEAGAGFAVVAEEVRNLAQRSAQSAKETSAKIEAALRNSDHGVQISAKVAESLNQIVEKARSMNSLVSEIANASNEQDKGITQLTTAVQQMDKVTQANASNAEETASASEELNAHADGLKETVVELVSLVNSNAREQRQSNVAATTARSRTSFSASAAARPVKARTPAKSTKSADKQHFLPMSEDDKVGTGV
jgi:methyl-accepting chemotaxis protein